MEPKNHPRFELLLKEIDLIDGNIKNLDDIIFKTKNFAFLIWGGSLYLIGSNLDSFVKVSTLIFLTSVIPVIFWIIHFRWQKHLTMCSQREKMISYFLNSKAFDTWIEKGAQSKASVHFPLYDVPGWLYTTKPSPETKNKWEELEVRVDEGYLLDQDAHELKWWKILFYKDAKWYYSIMIIISLFFGFMQLSKEALS